jgi:hypothetical protein
MYFVRKLYKEEKRPSGNAKKEAARTKTEVHNMYPGRKVIECDGGWGVFDTTQECEAWKNRMQIVERAGIKKACAKYKANACSCCTYHTALDGCRLFDLAVLIKNCLWTEED